MIGSDSCTGSKWHQKHKMAAPISGIFWLHCLTVGRSGGTSSIFNTETQCQRRLVALSFSHIKLFVFFGVTFFCIKTIFTFHSFSKKCFQLSINTSTNGKVPSRWFLKKKGGCLQSRDIYVCVYVCVSPLNPTQPSHPARQWELERSI